MATMSFMGAEKRVDPPPALRIKPNLPEHLELSAAALFAGLSPQECAEIVSCARARTFMRDEILFSQGQPVRNMILLQSGIVKHTQVGESGSEVLLRMSGTGEALHVQGDSGTCSHTCSARAMENCKAMVWESARLQALMTQYPRIRQNVSRILAGRLQELEERFREVATEKVARRLALILLRLIKQVGKPTDDGIQISLSREELAQMTGTTLFTISRIFSRWAEEGIVTPRREAVIVNDSRRLASVRDDSE
jgi:CRP/FNR family transcriptional regulator, nitrogen oxide reductase regulator